MSDEIPVQLVASLADLQGRFAAAQQLAVQLGATGLLILIEDPAVRALLPAPGFPQTLPGGHAWRELLAQVRTPGIHQREVGYPTPDQLIPALAYSISDVVLLFLGAPSKPPSVQAIQRLAPVVPLLAATLRAEHDALTVRGELAAAQNHAREVETLARALDGARSDLERTLRDLEGQTRAVEEARARAENATRAKDEFLAMLGHELRNPLSPIMTALQLMRLKNHSSREQDVIERQVGNLMRLVDDLLDVSRITRGKIELRKERVELADVAARAIEMASPVLEQKRQLLDVQIPSRGLVLDVDPTRLAQILANLLTNAAKYSDSESRIMFAAELKDTQIRIRVKDEGIGIAPELLGRVFEMFVQNGQSIDRSQGGLGLGLAIVRSLVQLHGGTVQAQSAGEGRGSEFIVELPRATEDSSHRTSPQPSTRRNVRAANLERVLVVDDNQDASTMLSEALDSLGFVVRTAPDGPAALRIVEEFEPDIALLDIGLPVMDGYELAQRLRERQGAGSLRLVAITGYGQTEDQHRSAQAGFDAHLVKPVDLDHLGRVLDAFRRPAVSGRGE